VNGALKKWLVNVSPGTVRSVHAAVSGGVVRFGSFCARQLNGTPC